MKIYLKLFKSKHGKKGYYFPVFDIVGKTFVKTLYLTFLQSSYVICNPKLHNTYVYKFDVAHITLWFFLDILEGPCAMAVRRSFVVLKKHLPFDILQDEFLRRNLISQDEIYMIMRPNKYSKTEQFLKLMIRKKRCKDLIACIKEDDTFSKNIIDALERTEQPSHLGNTHLCIYIYGFFFDKNTASKLSKFIYIYISRTN